MVFWLWEFGLHVIGFGCLIYVICLLEKWICWLGITSANSIGILENQWYTLVCPWHTVMYRPKLVTLMLITQENCFPKSYLKFIKSIICFLLKSWFQAHLRFLGLQFTGFHGLGDACAAVLYRAWWVEWVVLYGCSGAMKLDYDYLLSHRFQSDRLAGNVFGAWTKLMVI